MALWGDPLGPVQAGPVAVIAQSGNVAVNALASRRGLHLHTVVSCGNGAVLDAADFLSAVADREGVRSVALYLEDDGDSPRWLAALERCALAGVRVAMLKAGSSRAGAAAATAHTGAIAGDQRVIRAVFEECGAAWTEDPHELLEVAKALGAAPRRAGGGGREAAGGESRRAAGVTAPRPAGVAVMTCSGGDSAVAADLAARLAVALPALAPATLARLTAVLPAAATAGNPLDYTSLLWDDVAALRELGSALQNDPAIGQTLVFFDAYDGPAPILEAIDEHVLVASTLPELASEGAVGGIRAGLLAAIALRLQELPVALIELNPVIVTADGAVAVDALCEEEALT